MAAKARGEGVTHLRRCERFVVLSKSWKMQLPCVFWDLPTVGKKSMSLLQREQQAEPAVSETL